MGYYYTADIELVFTEPARISAALDLDSLNHSLKNDPYAWSGGALFAEAGRLIPDIEELLSWEVYDETTETRTVNGTAETCTIYQLTANAKFNTAVDVVVRWLASHGVGLNITCAGEDDEHWQYANPVGQIAFSEDKLNLVATRDIVRYRTAEATLDAARTLLARHANTSGAAGVQEADLLRQLRDVLLAPAPDLTGTSQRIDVNQLMNLLTRAA